MGGGGEQGLGVSIYHFVRLVSIPSQKQADGHDVPGGRARIVDPLS